MNKENENPKKNEDVIESKTHMKKHDGKCYPSVALESSSAPFLASFSPSPLGPCTNDVSLIFRIFDPPPPPVRIFSIEITQPPPPIVRNWLTSPSPLGIVISWEINGRINWFSDISQNGQSAAEFPVILKLAHDT